MINLKLNKNLKPQSIILFGGANKISIYLRFIHIKIQKLFYFCKKTMNIRFAS